MKKTIKIVLIVLLSLMVIIMIFNFTFGYLIKTQIKNFSKKSITLDYKSSHARLLLGSIEFYDAILHFNDISIDSSSSIFIESMSFEKFALSHLSLKSLLFDRSFNIEKVLLSGPSLEFLKDTTISRKDIFSKILTPKVVSSKSKSALFGFEIGELEIVQGSFELMENERVDFSIGSIDLKLSNISMEDLKVLNGDAPDLNAQFNIRLGIFDVRKDLIGDAELIIDSVIYEKDKRLFETGGILLKGIKSSTNFAESDMTIRTELISVIGFSLNHFISSNNLKFNKLSVSNTEVIEKLDYYNEMKFSNDKPTSKSLQFSYFTNTFITDTFQVQNFNYYATNNLSIDSDTIQNLNLFLYSIVVDSNFIINREYFKPLEKTVLSVDRINMHIPEIGIDLASNGVLYAGQFKKQKIAGLRLKTYAPLFSDNPDATSLDFIADSILISGLDEREWIDSSIAELSLTIQNFQVVGSNINLAKSTTSKSKLKIPDRIVFNKLNLVNGNLHLESTSNELLEIESLNIKAIDLEIFSNKNQSNKTVNWKNILTSFEKSKLNIPQGPLIQTKNSTINNNDLAFEGILFSEVFKIENFDASSKRLPDTARFFIDKVEIDNFDILSFIHKRYLTVDKLVISRPTLFKYAAFQSTNSIPADSISPLILYNRLNTLIPDHINYINIREFKLQDADLAYQMEQNNLNINSKFSFALRTIVFDQNLPEGKLPELKIEQHEYCISDVKLVSDNFQFVSENICYSSSEDKMIFTNSHADNISGAKIKSIQYDVDFPKIELTKLDLKPLSGSPFSFNWLHIIDPEIDVRIPQKQAEIKIERNNSSLLPFVYIEDGVSLENGKFKFILLGQPDSTTFKIDKMDLDAHEISKIFGYPNNLSDDRNLFSYLDFQLKNISITSDAMNLEIGNVKYDKQSGEISIEPINQQVFSKLADAKPKRSKSLIEIAEINIEQPDVMIVNERIQSFGASNLLVPEVNIYIESAEMKQKGQENKITIAANDSSLRNFLGKFDFFHIDSTVFNDIKFSHRSLSETTSGSFDIERVSLLVDKLKIDSSNFDFHQKRLAEDIVLQLYDREIVSADSMYRFKVNNVTYYYSRDKLVIDLFEVIPAFEREEFFERAGLQTDLMRVKFDRAVAEGIDLISLIESKKLQINKLTLDQFHLIDHRDKHYIRKENDFKKLPKEALVGLPFLLNIDTVKVNNSFLLYGEYVDKSPEPGEIYFTNFDASIYNVSNMHTDRNEHDSIFAHITTDIMDASKMTVNLTIPLDKDDDNFWVRGNMERVDLRKFNSMTENLFGISIVRGKGILDIPLITFTDTTSRGSVIFKYNKLKLSMYNRNKAKLSRGLGSGLIDFMLNGVLVKSNNPTFLGKTRTGEVLAWRNTERSFFNYIWKSTMSGLMSTMGFNNKEQRIEIKDRKYEEKIERKDEKQMNKLNK